MTVQLWTTPDGQEAYAVLGWVNGNPPARAREGLTRLHRLADQAHTTRGLHEIEDVAAICSRLLPPEGGTP